MKRTREPHNPHVYALLTPEFILGLVQKLGLWPDGRLLALNSFENRVYLVWLDEAVRDAQGASHASIVLKAYRPGRWSAEQILEEHAFARELAEEELPVAAPWDLRALTQDRPASIMAPDGQSPESVHFAGDTLVCAGPFQVAIWARQGGRAPEIDGRKCCAGSAGWLRECIGWAVGAPLCTARAFAEWRVCAKQSRGLRHSAGECRPRGIDGWGWRNARSILPRCG